MTDAPWAFDHTALVGLFDGYDVPYSLWLAADRDEARVVFPASAIAEAAHLASTRESAWERLLRDIPGLTVTDLSQATGLACAHAAGPLVARHVLWEARQVGGIVLTRAPWQYPTGQVAVQGF